MINKKNVPPIIIMGMHRSGTSMVTQMLEELGLFVGKKQESNQESVFFQSLNKWIMRQCGGSWDYPGPVKDLLHDKESCALILDYLRFVIKTPRIISFLGIKKYLHYNSIENIDIPWGWKDPRNTFTLPFWLNIFPKAKIINIYRNGIDVAQSLKIRRDKSTIAINKRSFMIKIFYSTIRKEIAFIPSVKCVNLEGGFSLWEEYMRAGNEHVIKYGPQIITIKYENLLKDPYTNLSKILIFSGLRTDENKIHAVIDTINKKRAYAYRNNQKLQIVANDHRERLAAYDY